MKNDHLHLFIDEEIYLVGQPATSSPKEDNGEVAAPAITPAPVAKNKLKPVAGPEVPPTPKVPVTPTLPFGFYTLRLQPAEKELLNKIIAACKIPTTDYKVFEDGPQHLRSKKAVVFVDEPKESPYQPIKKGQTEVIYSKSLSTLMHSQDDKMKLWGILQPFIK